MSKTKSITLSDILGIEFPVIMAPMFLVSDEKMVVEALKAGITGAIPALNFRKVGDMKNAIRSIKKKSNKPFGINLIVNKSNHRYKEQLQACCEEKVDFIITSLGSPEETILRAHERGIKVFCDVTDIKFALKVEKLGADAIIAVNKEAGGHAGNFSYHQLIPELVALCNIPIISAGGIGSGFGIKEVLNFGACGVSMGSIFIASDEAPVSEEYKNACVQYGAKDIVMTTKISGTPCTVINTPYVKEVGTSQTKFEKFLTKNKRFKRWFKTLLFIKGMKKLERAAFSSTYQNVWCAGPSIEFIKKIRPISEIVRNLKEEFFNCDLKKKPFN